MTDTSVSAEAQVKIFWIIKETVSSSVRSLLKNFGGYFVICMSFPWKGCFDIPISVPWNFCLRAVRVLPAFLCDVKYHMGTRSYLHPKLSLTKIPWVILLLLTIKTSKEVIFTLVNWFYYSFLFILIPFLECMQQEKVFAHSKLREKRIGVLYKKEYI